VTVQRRVDIRVISAYRTIAGDAAAILAGLLSSDDLLARCYWRIYYVVCRARELDPELTARARAGIRKRERLLAIDEWLVMLRERGERAPGARVREALIPIFKEWVEERAWWTHIPGHANYNGA